MHGNRKFCHMPTRKREEPLKLIMTYIITSTARADYNEINFDILRKPFEPAYSKASRELGKASHEERQSHGQIEQYREFEQVDASIRIDAIMMVHRLNSSDDRSFGNALLAPVERTPHCSNCSNHKNNFTVMQQPASAYLIHLR